MPDKEELYDEAIDAYADDKFDEAIELYKKALEIDSKYADAIHGMIMCYQAKGDLDTAIALRTIVVRDGTAYVQAAAGIVADSSIHEETLEIDNKVAAQILAVEEANAWARR